MKNFYLFTLLLLIVLAFQGCSPKLSSSSDPQQKENASKQLLPDELLAHTLTRSFQPVTGIKMDEIIGYSDNELAKGRLESPLGNLVADILFEKVNYYLGPGVDMAAITTGTLRASIPQGEVKMKHVYDVLPFDNKVVILGLNGNQVTKLFEYLVAHENLAVANAVVVTTDKKVNRVFINGFPFDPEKNYTLAVSDYLAQGGDQLGFLKFAKVLHQSDIKERDLVVEYLYELHQQEMKIHKHIDERIKIRHP
jgi:2',3'-cyclic-nucleotide 2'-phosphodiesterase (5'-nucleotidase family)